ncbi:hypothetical protein F4811DRAFT_569854 [Daldinia bambusicola]|nr:hypothetical protein F4811DRAFT_569854 [Daldinia bambusicola]
MSARPSEERIAFMLAHKDESLVPAIIVCVAICNVASIAFILLRLYSQYLVSRRLSLTQSDILLLLGLIVAEASYSISLLFIKLGILRLYGTIFPSKRFHKFLWIFAICIIIFHLICFTTNLSQCIPIQYNWDTSIKGGHCVDYGLFTLLSGILNIINDFIILLYPIPQVLPLHISKHKKMLLIFTFAMGGSACVVSIVRLPYSLEFNTTDDPTYDSTRMNLLSLVELMAGILATSIPTYRPLFRQIMASRGRSSIDSPKNTYKKSGKDDISGGTRISPVITSGTLPEQVQTNFPGINVTSHVELARYTNIGGNWIRVPDEVSEGWK